MPKYSIGGFMTYKYLKTGADSGNVQSTSQILRTTDNAIIPFDPDNMDYQAYLTWIDDGNTPAAAD